MSDALTRIGTLKRGLKIGDVVHKEFELRQCTSADYFAAEKNAEAGKDITFRAALCAQQLVRIGDFKGPFTLAMLGTLSPGDMSRLSTAREELEIEGEAQQPG